MQKSYDVTAIDVMHRQCWDEILCLLLCIYTLSAVHTLGLGSWLTLFNLACVYQFDREEKGRHFSMLLLLKLSSRKLLLKIALESSFFFSFFLFWCVKNPFLLLRKCHLTSSLAVWIVIFHRKELEKSSGCTSCISYPITKTLWCLDDFLVPNSDWL